MLLLVPLPLQFFYYQLLVTYIWWEEKGDYREYICESKCGNPLRTMRLDIKRFTGLAFICLLQMILIYQDIPFVFYTLIPLHSWRFSSSVPLSGGIPRSFLLSLSSPLLSSHITCIYFSVFLKEDELLKAGSMPHSPLYI